MEEQENIENGSVPKSEDAAKSCALCGCSTPAVRCDRCGCQIFCLSCDDMYHRHPKRRLHLRKAVDSIWSSSRSPRLRRRTELPGDPSKIPIPPPRSKKRERHTIAGRMFLKPGFEPGSFSHNKAFDLKSLIPPKAVYSRPRMPPNTEETYENDAVFSRSRTPNNKRVEEIYENDSVAVNQEGSRPASGSLEHNPWNSPRSNVSPSHTSIPSSTPDPIANGQSFELPPKTHSKSITDLPNTTMNPLAQHLPHMHPYPFMHSPVQPPYSHSMAHLNCPQCLSSSWSNLMGSHPSPYFHPMTWGHPHASLNRDGTPSVPQEQLKHSHGDLGSFPGANYPFPYPGGVFYPNGVPAPDPNFMKDHTSSGTPKVRRSPSSSRSSRHAHSTEDLQAMNVEAVESTVNKFSDEPGDNFVDKVKQNESEDAPKLPVTPKKPWSCLHCTFINPPGVYICQVCCKTSYGNKQQSDSEENRMDSPITDNRNSESPMELVNMDSEIMSSEFSKLKAQKVI